MLSKFKTVYVLAPHTDDGELGAGATIAKLIEEGANVYYFSFSTAETSVPEGFPKENVIIYNYEVRKLNYARQEGLRTFKETSILGYELIWNNLTFNTTSFVKLDKKYIQAKCDALKEYKSQGSRDYMSEAFIFALARTRGLQRGSTYAESFEVIPWVM
jgi:LmbE family N-acetylglucosaminyl deacetylase